MLFSTIGYRLWPLAVGCGLWGLAVGYGLWGLAMGINPWKIPPQQPKTSQESLQTDRSVEAYPQQVLVPFSGNQNPNAPNAVGSP